MPTSTTRALLGLSATALVAGSLLVGTAPIAGAQPRPLQPQTQTNQPSLRPPVTFPVRVTQPPRPIPRPVPGSAPAPAPFPGVTPPPPAPAPAPVPPPGVVAAAGISFTYDVGITPCFVRNKTCLSASVTGTVAAVGAPTPKNAELRTAMYFKDKTGAVISTQPWLWGPGGPSVALPQAAGSSTATVTWASVPLAQTIPFPPNATEYCIYGQIFVNGVAKGGPTAPNANKTECRNV
jgi:hypothetical protein